jgi:hypothetical protein
VLPTVRVLDAFGNPVPGAGVVFQVIAGGGSVTGASVSANSLGHASPASWTLGINPGTNILRASSLFVEPVDFTAHGVGEPDGDGYNIQLIFLSSVTPSQHAAFTNAAARWESIITGDLPNVAVIFDAGECGSNSPALNQVVDDVFIYVTLEPIDGQGGVLASAGPCRVRGAVPRLPITGRMRFDVADVANLESNGAFEAVILHEMGHVLGIGTLWNFLGLLQNPSLPDSPGADTHFSGSSAISAFDMVGGSSYLGAKVPVENTQGGSGTRDGHWRESIMDNELMTGFLDSGPNPLSIVTIFSLQDLGYQVNAGAADPYVLPSGGALRVFTSKWHLLDDVNRDPVRTGGSQVKR